MHFQIPLTSEHVAGFSWVPSELGGYLTKKEDRQIEEEKEDIIGVKPISPPTGFFLVRVIDNRPKCHFLDTHLDYKHFVG